MRHMRKWLLLAILAPAAGAGAAQVVLNSGATVTGEILRQDEQVVIVDLGVAVLRLERSAVAEILATDDRAETEMPDDETDVLPIDTLLPSWQLYLTAELPPRSIERNVERFGEAVIMVRSPQGLGSGFIISPDGYVITNYHVIAQETEIRVVMFRQTAAGFEQQTYRRVRIVALNPFVDLALLKIEDDEAVFPFVYLGDMERVEVGQEVFAIGNPLGLTRTVSQGIVSTRNRNFEGRLYVQTTADVNPGNSGGPLFNNRGEVIGVTSMGYVYLGGLNFAIPVDVVKRFVDNRDAFAYDEDNPNTGYRYLQPSGRVNDAAPPGLRLPE